MRNGKKLGHLIKLVGMSYEATKNSLLEEFGITASQMELLDYINDCDEHTSTQKEVTEYLRASYATVSGLIKRLVEKDLLERVKCEGDRRSNTIKLTEQALPLVEACKIELQTIDDELTADFTDEEQQQLAAYLERLLANADGIVTS